MDLPNSLKPALRPIFFAALGLKNRFDGIFFREPSIPEYLGFHSYPDLVFPKQPDQGHLEKIVGHRFDLLGSGETDLGKIIDWNSDFRSGFRWKNEFYKSIRIVDLSKKADVKMVWELSRFQHLPLLSAGYLESGDRKLLEELKSQLDSWMAQNPYGYSVNWACTMDVAIRSVNVLLAYILLKDEVDRYTKDNIERFLYLHGKFIRDNLEWGFRRGNHYLSNICGLYILSLFFDTPESMGWGKFAKRELEAEIRTQVFSDGASHECSLSYHRLVLELFLYPYIIGTKAGKTFSSEYRSQLKKMLVFLLWCTKPNGLVPQIGDNDDGRLFRFDPYLGSNDHRYLLAIGAVLFEDGRFKEAAREFQLDAYWFLGKAGEERFDAIRGIVIEGHRYFENVGIFVYRKDPAYLIFNIGTDKGMPGHKHNDLLSFELSIGAQDIIVDPGTGVYSGDYRIRNQFRSIESHNTFSIDSQEPRRFDEKVLFSIDESTTSRMVSYVQKDDKVEIKGEYCAFGFPCYRTLDIGKGKITITDECQSDDCAGYLQIPIADIIFISNRSVEVFGVRIDSSSKLEKEGSVYSPRYGVIRKSTKLKYRFSRSNTLEVVVPDWTGGEGK